MKYFTQIVETICGVKPDYVEIIDPENDPNFVFEPNP